MIRIGKIVATHGLTGSLILTHVVGNSKWLKKGQVLLVEMQKGSHIPYFIAQCKANNDKEYIINVEDIDKIESAKKLVTKQVYVDESILADYAKDSPLLWIGFTVIDKDKEVIGLIDDVSQTGYQWLASITYTGVEVLIPLIGEIIEKVDIRARTINVVLPEGLLEVYL
jgi:16S rRNA processing protein RimM